MAAAGGRRAASGEVHPLRARQQVQGPIRRRAAPAAGACSPSSPEEGSAHRRRVPAAIDAVSASGRVRWGVEHLHYEIARRRRRRKFPVALRVVFFVVGMAVGTAVHSWVLGLIVGGLAAFGVPPLLRRLASPTLTVTTDEFDRLWKRWQGVHGSPKGVIVRRSHPMGPRVRRAGPRRLLVRSGRDLRPRPDRRPAGGQQLPLREQLRRALHRWVPARPLRDDPGHAPPQPAAPGLRPARRHAPGCRLAHQLGDRARSGSSTCRR